MSSSRRRGGATPLSEFKLIERIARLPKGEGSRILEGIGDDAALLRPRRGWDLVATVDAQVEGVHFRRQWMGAADVGWRALAVNLSDLAAMGATPLAALASASMPADWSSAELLALHRGLAACGRRYQCPLVGGNLSATRAKGALELHVTVLGEVPRGKALRRCGARVGDTIWVSGEIGGSSMGLAELKAARSKRGARTAAVRRFVKPMPRLALGQGLARAGVVHAAIDVSDGLLADLGHLLEKMRGLGAEIWVDAIPLPRAFRAKRKARHYGEVLRALRGGEDYELLFCAPAKTEGKIHEAARGVHVSVQAIGKIVGGHGISLVTGEGHPLQYAGPTGWRHR